MDTSQRTIVCLTWVFFASFALSDTVQASRGSDQQNETRAISDTRQFECNDTLEPDRVIARSEDGQDTLVINRNGEAGSCEFDLEHISSEGRRSLISTTPSGYLMASLKRLSQGALIACATRIDSESTGVVNTRIIKTADIECALESAHGWGSMVPLISGHALTANWLDFIDQEEGSPDAFSIHFLADSTFNFMNLFNEGRPVSDGSRKLFVHISGDTLIAGTMDNAGAYVQVPKADGVLQTWTPRDYEKNALIASGWFDEDDFSNGDCPLPYGCAIDQENTARTSTANHTSTPSHTSASMPNTSQSPLSGGTTGNTSSPSSICSDALECLDGDVDGSIQTGIEMNSPELSTSCRLWDGQLKGQFSFSLEGTLEVEGCPTCSGHAQLDAQAHAMGSLCGQAEFEAHFEGRLNKKRQHCVGCADQNHKICLPEYCDEDAASGSAHLEVSQFVGFKPKALTAGPVSATFRCGATMKGALDGQGTAKDYRTEGCQDCLQCESMNAHASATLSADVSCGLELKVKRLGTANVGCRDCGGISLSVGYDINRSEGPDCPTKNCQKAHVNASAYAQTECISVGYGWFSVGVQCAIDGSADVATDTCAGPASQASWSASCWRC